ncbi:MAG: glycosyltransferase family 39 protein [Chloroflexi bacterium]|nr:glycosyltransferase family 39 protein [Chloroflexota bacterium]
MLARRARAARGAWLLGALVFAMLGQGAWLLQGPLVDGLVGYTLAVLCLLRASPGAPLPPDLFPTREEGGPPSRSGAGLEERSNLPVRPASWPDRTGWALLALGAGAILIGSLRGSLEHTASALALPYLSGVLLLLVGVMPPLHSLHGTREHAPILSLITKASAASRGVGLRLGFGLAALCLLGLALRVIRLGELPLGVWYDEAAIGLEAVRILEDPSFRPLYSQGTTSPAAYLSAVAGSLALWGQTVEGLRFVSALAGALTVPAWYAFLREGFPARVALAGTLLMAVNRWDLTFSRLAMQGVMAPLLEVAVLGLLLAALRRGSLLLAVAAGLVLGAGLAFYSAFLAFPLVIGGYLALRLLTEADFWRAARRTLALFALAALLGGLPVLTFAALHPETFGGRIAQAAMTDHTGARGLVATLAETTDKHLLMFHREGDYNGRHNLPGAPMLDPLTGVLAALGLGWSLRHPRQPFSVLGVLWLGIMLLPGILSLPFEAPQGLRAIGALPAVLLLACTGLDRLWSAADTVLGPARRHQGTAVVVGLLALMATLNVDTYFRRQAQDAAAWAAHSTAETIIGRRLAGLPAGRDEVYLSGLYRDHPTIRFLAGPTPLVHTFTAAADLPLRSGSATTLLFLEPREEYAYRLLRRWYPGATCEEVTVRPGVMPPVMYACTVPGAAVRSVQGLDRTLLGGTEGLPGRAGGQDGEAVTLHWGAGEVMSAPLTATWTGAVHAPQAGSYGLRVTGTAAEVAVTVDGARLLEGPQREGRVDLAQGIHRLEVSASALTAQGFLRLLWQPPGAAWQPLPAAQAFRTPVVPVGLTGSYYPNPDGSGPPAFRRVDPTIALYFHLVPLERPYAVEWTGSLLVPAPGNYRLGLRAISAASLTLEGMPVVEVTVPGQQQEREVTLAQGSYRLRLRFRDQDSYSQVYLLWAPPGGTLQPIPPEALRPW